MILDVYIGYLDDPDFKLEGGNWNGNIPKRRSDFFEDSHRIFWKIVKGIDNGIYKGKQVDWAGWVVLMTKEELKFFLNESYFVDIDIEKETIIDKDYYLKNIKSISKFIESLDDELNYALVAIET